MILATEIVSHLAIKSSSSSLLRKYFAEWFLEESNEEADVKNLDIIFKNDHLLWKSVRLNLTEILNSCNAIDQELKKQIGKNYILFIYCCFNLTIF